ncbi:MAG: aminopeptidase P N-terminal domain-containing protein [Ideonella sp.]|nr:aminopeptidase P N-terminal domain-containing protein [Ideonella sp.]
MALLPTAPARLRNADNDFAYRHDSHFFHLTGFAEPEAWLVLNAEGRSILFCQPRDEAREIWDGLRVGPERAPALLGVDEAHAAQTLDELMPGLLANQASVWFPFGGCEGLQARVAQWLDAVRRRTREGLTAPARQHDLAPVLAGLRLVTRCGTPARSALAHVRAMRFCAQRWREGATAIAEHEIEAELLHEFRRHGANGVAYTPIVAAGANACILHGRGGQLGLAAPAASLKQGELCLIDAGREHSAWAAPDPHPVATRAQSPSPANSRPHSPPP